MARTSRAVEVEELHGVPLRDLLHKWYWEDQLSTAAIAERLRVSPSGVRKWMIKYGIPCRDLENAQATIISSGRRKPTTMPSQAGPANHNWKGGTVKHSKGYILRWAPDHPESSGGYVLEHRLVAEQMMGRVLLPDEDVHHKDGEKTNNDPSNLEVVRHSEHAKLHWSMKKNWCNSVAASFEGSPSVA